jgi:hypothetical protein
MPTATKHASGIVSKLQELRDRSRSASKLSAHKLLFEKKHSGKKNSENLLKKQRVELDFLLSSVFPQKQKDITLSDEIESVSNALTSIADIAEQGIITRDESAALSRFLTSRFAEKYLMHVLNQTLAEIQFERPKDFYMHFMRGALNK